MADLSDINAAQSVKILGADTAGVEQTPVGSSLNGDLQVSNGLKEGGATAAKTTGVANTAVEVFAGVARLANRKSLIILIDDGTFFWGYDNTVTAANGIPAINGQTLSFDCKPGSNFQVWLVNTANTKKYRVAESP